MTFLDHFNLVTILIFGAFFLPILLGFLRPLSGAHIRESLGSLLNTLELLASMLLSVYFARVVLADDDNVILRSLYRLVPSAQDFISSRSIVVYLLFILVFLLVISFALRILTIPIYTLVIVPVANLLGSAVRSMNGFFRRIAGALWKIPNSICAVLILSLLLSAYSSVYGSTSFAKYIRASSAYQYTNANMIGPLLSSQIARRIPVILNDSFKFASEGLSEKAKKALVIKYFNGTTLEEAVKSNAEINATAKAVAGTGSSDKEKAYLIYKWICKNITYDDQKAALLTSASGKVVSGARAAYQSRSGVCFDYACLYVAMCRAVNVKVRFLTGLGYSGAYWGDHSWNEVYDPAGKRWINVDTTFGSANQNYFDRQNFKADHKDSVIQGEW